MLPPDRITNYPEKRDDKSSYVIVSVILAASIFALVAPLVLLVQNFSLFNFILCAASLFLLGGLIPATLEDIGWYLVDSRRQYRLGEGFLVAADHLYRRIEWRKGSCTSMGALRLGQLNLMFSRFDEADKWATKSLTMAQRDADWCKLYSLSLLSQLRFAEKRFEEAEEFLDQAVKIHENLGRAPFVALKNKIDDFQAQNLNLLGKLMLRKPDYARAADYFDKSLALRKLVPRLNGTAQAYQELSSGRLIYKDRPLEAAQHFICALRLFPARAANAADHELAIEIGKAVIANTEEGSEDWAKAHDLIAQTSGRGLHPRLLDLAARSSNTETE